MQNVYLSELEHDTLYHLGLDSKTHDFSHMFSDVRFVIMGGSSKRMRNFSQYLVDHLPAPLPTGTQLQDITEKANRYSMFKVGPVLAVSVSL